MSRRTKHQSSLLPCRFRETSHTMKRLKTKQKRYHGTHLSVQELLLMSYAMVQEDNTRYESQLATTRSSANLFKYFKAFKKVKIPSKLKWGKEEAHSDTKKARLFADVFASSYKTSSKYEEPISQDMFYPKCENVEYTRQEIAIINICCQLPVSTTKGPDNLRPILFREVSDHISASLFQIFKKCSKPQPFLQFGKKPL